MWAVGVHELDTHVELPLRMRDITFCLSYHELTYRVMNKRRVECGESIFLGSIVVSIRACHVRDPGSIPGRGVYFLQVSYVTQVIARDFYSKLEHRPCSCENQN